MSMGFAQEQVIDTAQHSTAQHDGRQRPWDGTDRLSSIQRNGTCDKQVLAALQRSNGSVDDAIALLLAQFS